MFHVTLGVTLWFGSCGMSNWASRTRLFTTYSSWWVIIHR